MSRPKKDGRKATGIQRKKGYLYIVITQPVIKDGLKVTKSKWISTSLQDTPENVKKAVDMRARLLVTRNISPIDRSITIGDYLDLYLQKKSAK